MNEMRKLMEATKSLFEETVRDVVSIEEKKKAAATIITATEKYKKILAKNDYFDFYDFDGFIEHLDEFLLEFKSEIEIEFEDEEDDF
jgi:hypothetical protein